MRKLLICLVTATLPTFCFAQDLIHQQSSKVTSSLFKTQNATKDLGKVNLANLGAADPISVKSLSNGKSELLSPITGKTVSLDDVSVESIYANVENLLGVALDSLNPLELAKFTQDILNKVAKGVSKTEEKGPVSMYVSLVTDSISPQEVYGYTSTLKYELELDDYLEIKSGPLQNSKFYAKNRPKVKINNVHIKFEDGSIQSMVLSVEEDGREHIYSSILPIPVATTRNLVNKLGRAVLVRQSDGAQHKQFVYVNEFLSINPHPLPNTGNITPENQIVCINADEKKWKIPVRKEPLANVLDARIYSDFLGLKENVGNGLLQIEVSKKIFITNSYVFPRRNNFRDVKPSNGEINFYKSWMYMFHYIEPVVSWNKLEGTDRVLELNPSDIIASTNQGDSLGYVSNLDVMNYASFTAGLRLNILDIHYDYGNFEIMVEGAWRQTPLTKDLTSSALSAFKIDRLNSYSFGGGLSVSIHPETYYSITGSVSYQRFKAPHLEFKAVPSFDPSTFSQNVEISGTKASNLLVFSTVNTIRLSKTSKLFVRARFNYDLSSQVNNYYEVQVGTSFDILSDKNKK